jgi:AcrR family transcriptional regulator
VLDVPKRDRRAEQRAAVRAEILDAAWDVAHEAGLAAMTLRDVAERIGMRAPSLYTHFPSKMAIVDAMYAQAWTAYLELIRTVDRDLPPRPREALARVVHTFFDFAAADLARYQLMNQRTLPGFTPTPDSYAPAVEVLTRLDATLHRLGIDEPEARDMFTALVGGFIDQQLANDPGGDRWRRLLGRAIDMYADHVGLPGPPLQEHR